MLKGARVSKRTKKSNGVTKRVNAEIPESTHNLAKAALARRGKSITDSIKEHFESLASTERKP